MLQHEPHLFADVRQAVAGLNAYVTEWSSYFAYEIIPVMGEGVAYAGFHVRAFRFTGEPVAYIAPAA